MITFYLNGVTGRKELKDLLSLSLDYLNKDSVAMPDHVKLANKIINALNSKESVIIGINELV